MCAFAPVLMPHHAGRWQSQIRADTSKLVRCMCPMLTPLSWCMCPMLTSSPLLIGRYVAAQGVSKGHMAADFHIYGCKALPICHTCEIFHPTGQM